LRIVVNLPFLKKVVSLLTTTAEISAKLTVAETALVFHEIPVFLSGNRRTKFRGKCSSFDSMKKINCRLLLENIVNLPVEINFKK